MYFDIDIALLLMKYHNKDDFSEAYKKLYDKGFTLSDPTNLKTSLTESLSHKIDLQILIDVIWVGREYIINSLRENKLKRILKRKT